MEFEIFLDQPHSLSTSHTLARMCAYTELGKFPEHEDESNDGRRNGPVTREERYAIEEFGGFVLIDEVLLGLITMVL